MKLFSSQHPIAGMTRQINAESHVPTIVLYTGGKQRMEVCVEQAWKLYLEAGGESRLWRGAF